jgi:hypothetical protein
MAELPAKRFDKTPIKAASANKIEIYPRPSAPHMRVDKTTNPKEAKRPMTLENMVVLISL